MPREFISERSMIEAARFIASSPPSRAVGARLTIGSGIVRPRRRIDGIGNVSQPLLASSREGPPDVRRRALLDEALDALPADLRTVFVLFELEELSAPEVAELVGIPLGTVVGPLGVVRQRRHRDERARDHAPRSSGRPCGADSLGRTR